MKQQIKMILGAVLFMVLASGCASPPLAQPAMLLQSPTQQPGESTMRTVQVSGAGEARVKPDTAVINLGVRTQDKTAQAALQKNNTKTQALINALRKADIPAENIQTQAINLAPNYETNKTDNNQTLAGYTASNIVEVRTADLESVGTLLDQAVNAGANTIENIRFEVSDSGKLLDQVRETAVQNAQHKAEQLAKLTGATLGPVLEIQETSRIPSPILGQTSAETAGVPVSPGTQSVSVQVQVTWTLVVNK
jgi:uncharacterized protein YggE